MGGLIGKLSFEHDEALARPVLEQMLDTVRPRRRGAAGLFLAPGIALGGHDEFPHDDRADPIGSSEDGTIRVVADASLTNAPAVRRQLQRLGHRFCGSTDAELIAHAYEEWGECAVDSFGGPFACAVWDGRLRRLMLARDHMGVRPMFFALLPGRGVVFGSTITALLQDPGVGRECCPEAIDAYLALGYVPAPLTAYRRISKLEPAHRLTVEGRRFHVEQYWDLPAASAAAQDRDTIDELDDRLRAAVGADLKDPRASALLFSGGTASCALLPHAAAVPAIVTIAVEQEASDLARSHAAVAHFGGQPYIEVAMPDAAVVAVDLAARFEEPMGDPSAVTQYATCVAARMHTEDALAGHGAAALWAGYARHRVEHLEALLRTWFGAPLAGLGGLAKPVQEAVKGARSLSHLALPAASACAVKHAYGLWEDEHRRALYTRGFAWEVRDVNPFSRHLELYAARDTADPLDRALYVEARTSLPGNTLVIADAAALSAGIRLRFPYLDRQLVEFAATMPSSLKQTAGAGMLPIRQLIARHLPPALMPRAYRRATRHGWLRDALGVLVPHVLLGERADGRGIVSRPALRQFWEEHRTGRRDHAHRLWSLLMLEFWFREFIDGDAAEQPTEYALSRVA